MSVSLWNTVLLAGVFLLLFVSAEVLYRFFNFKAEVTRKYVHVSTGLLTMLFPPLIGNHWLILLLCGSFLVIIVLSMRFNLLPSVNDVDRVTRGGILFPVVVYCSYLVFQHYEQYMFYYIPILILALADPAAALMGKKFKIGPYTTFGHTKTWIGSVSFFFVASWISLVFISGVDGLNYLRASMISLVVAFVTTAAEAMSHKGYDNITIPGMAILVLIIFKEWF